MSHEVLRYYVAKICKSCDKAKVYKTLKGTKKLRYDLFELFWKSDQKQELTKDDLDEIKVLASDASLKIRKERCRLIARRSS